MQHWWYACAWFAQETYYTPPLQEGPAQKISKGKLIDKYRNVRKLLKAAGAVPSSSKPSPADTLTEDSGAFVSCFGH